MRDLVITLPGIMGSQLFRGQDNVWDPGPGFVGKLLRHRRWVAGLALDPADDPTRPLAPDGLVPRAPTRSHTIIPGLLEIDGYTELDKAVRTAFGEALVEGDPLQPERRRDDLDPRQHGVPNYYQFAYDWRRDIRSAALRLADLIDVALPALVGQRSPQAKVVLLGHSMGGLVARHYLFGTDLRTGRPLGGWEKVREVVTLGTPYRGSTDALQYLLLGYRKLFVDFTETARTYPSLYALLPRYRVVHDRRSGAAPDTWLYPHELTGMPGLDPVRARAAYEEIHSDLDTTLADLGEPARRLTTPHIGFGHPTANSVVLTDDGISLSHSAPAYLDAVYDGGDGTVPLISAIPLELDGQRAALRYLNQRHGSLQSDRRTLESEIHQRLRQSQSSTADARDPGVGAGPEAPAVGLAGPSVFLAGEQAYAEVSVTGVAAAAALTVRVQDLAAPGTGTTVPAAPGERVHLPSAPGDYRVEVGCVSPRLTSQAFYAVVDPDAPLAD